MKTLFAAIALLSFTSPAFAAVLDFTDTSQNIEGSSWSGELDGVGVTLSAAPEADPADPDDVGAVLQQTGYGVGVNYDEGYLAGMQVEGEEILTVTFDEPQEVTGFSVSNLYETSGFGFLIVAQDEQGSYTIGDTEYTFEANSATGQLEVDFTDEFGDSVNLQTITFKAVGGWTTVADNGFTLQSISTADSSVTAVPELDPGAMPGAVAVLVGSALVLNGRRRERA